MKIAFVTYLVPWRPKYGGSLRAHGILRGLARMHEVHVVLAACREDEMQAFEEWEDIPGIRRHVLHPTNGYPQDDWQASRTMRSILSQGKYGPSLEDLVMDLEPDVVWYHETEALRRTKRVAFPRVLDLVDVQWMKRRRASRNTAGMAKVSEYARTGRVFLADQLAAAQMDAVGLASGLERSGVLLNRSRHVIPNGCDFPDHCPEREAVSPRVLFFGSLFYWPNRDGIEWYCRDVWPRVLAEEPSASLDVVGAGLEESAAIEASPRTTVHGFVEDLPRLLGSASHLIVPLHEGGGTRIKIIEAWASGLPVLSTTIGAEGLGAEPGVHLLVEDDPAQLATASVALLRDPKNGERLAARGFAYGKQHYDWPRVWSQSEDMLRSVVEPTA